MLRDTSYALVRRLDFIENALREHVRKRDLSRVTIADIGCGTGELLTLPLALRLGNIATIFAYEPEAASYAQLCQQIRDLNINNVHPVQYENLIHEQTYDAIIISEVLEHVGEPIDFLKAFKMLLTDHGIMLITTPNGYGIFELETLIFNSLDMLGIIPFLKNVRSRLNPSKWKSTQPTHMDTLAISPHVNFFSLPELYYILQEVGLSVLRIEGRNFAAGPFSDKVIDQSNYLITLNSNLGKILPLRLATDWMLIAKRTETLPQGNNAKNQPPKLNPLQKIYTSYKRWLNLYLSERVRKQRND